MGQLSASQKMQVEWLRDSLRANGFYPFPCNPDKSPRRGHKVKVWDEEGEPVFVPYEAQAGSLLTAVRLVKSLAVIDVDIQDAAIAAQVEQLAILHFGKTVIRTRENTPKVALFYRADFSFPKLEQKVGLVVELRQQSEDKLSSFYQLVDGCLDYEKNGVITQGRYRFRSHHLKDTPLADLPLINKSQMASFLSACEPLTGLRVKEKPADAPEVVSVRMAAHSVATDDEQAYGRGVLKSEIKALAQLREGAGRNPKLNSAAYRIGRRVGAGFIDRDEAEQQLWEAANQCGTFEDRGKDQTQATIASGLESGIANPDYSMPASMEPEPWMKELAAKNDPTKRTVMPIEVSTLIASIDDAPDPLQLAHEPVEYAIAGLVSFSAVTIFTGLPGSGKSSLIAAMASHVANATPFLEMPRLKATRCLYIDRENSLPYIQSRFRRMKLQVGPNFKYLGEHLGEVPEPNSAMVIEWVRAQNPKPVVFIDSGIRFLNANENSSEDVAKFMKKLRTLASMGCAVVLLHHQGKGESSKGYRGSSDWLAGCDSMFALENAGGNKLTHLTLEALKQRDYANYPSVIRYHDGIFYPLSSGAEVPANDALTALLEANPKIKSGDFERMAMDLGIASHVVRGWVKQGIQLGAVSQIVGQRNTKFLSSGAIRVFTNPFETKAVQ